MILFTLCIILLKLFDFDRLQVAYVLGQLQNKKASDALSQVLRDVNEHPMVRHEAAEALGSIAGSASLYVILCMHIEIRIDLQH